MNSPKKGKAKGRGAQEQNLSARKNGGRLGDPTSPRNQGSLL